MKKGFTLIELLVVVLIIGILAAIALPQYTKAVEKSRVAEILILGGALKNAQEIYYMQTGAYATNITDLDIEIPGNCTERTTTDIIGLVCKKGNVSTNYQPLISNSGHVNHNVILVQNWPVSTSDVVYLFSLENSAYPNKRYCTFNAASVNSGKGGACKSLGTNAGARNFFNWFNNSNDTAYEIL
ncbi:prepilin-type N-terminal cleavage/methylation domain-containing protein [Elusimicrobium posterum]|uniref:type IV pilin protein n=1 Tax=Elusimicrobium posterum TaxID=3116653 RepID=UPI003C72DDFC